MNATGKSSPPSFRHNHRLGLLRRNWTPKLPSLQLGRVGIQTTIVFLADPSFLHVRDCHECGVTSGEGVLNPFLDWFIWPPPVTMMQLVWGVGGGHSKSISYAPYPLFTTLHFGSIPNWMPPGFLLVFRESANQGAQRQAERRLHFMDLARDVDAASESNQRFWSPVIKPFRAIESEQHGPDDQKREAGT